MVGAEFGHWNVNSVRNLAHGQTRRPQIIKAAVEREAERRTDIRRYIYIEREGVRETVRCWRICVARASLKYIRNNCL